MTSPAFGELIKDLQEEMGAVTDIKEANRASPFKDQLSMVAEGMGALQWVVFEGKPADYVAEVIGGVQMFGNRVLKEYREKYVKATKTCRFLNNHSSSIFQQGPSPGVIRPSILRAMAEPPDLH